MQKAPCGVTIWPKPFPGTKASTQRLPFVWAQTGDVWSSLVTQNTRLGLGNDWQCLLSNVMAILIFWVKVIRVLPSVSFGIWSLCHTTWCVEAIWNWHLVIYITQLHALSNTFASLLVPKGAVTKHPPGMSFNHWNLLSGSVYEIQPSCHRAFPTGIFRTITG